MSLAGALFYLTGYLSSWLAARETTGRVDMRDVADLRAVWLKALGELPEPDRAVLTAALLGVMPNVPSDGK